MCGGKPTRSSSTDAARAGAAEQVGEIGILGSFALSQKPGFPLLAVFWAITRYGGVSIY